MAFEKAVQLMQGGGVLAEFGPMRLVIFASVGKIPQPDMGLRAAEQSFTYLEQVARLRHVLSKRVSDMPVGLDDPLATSMIGSVTSIGDEDLTPMAAVAGTIADAVADFLFERGMTKVVINNGGDVAVRLQGEAYARVGVRPDINKRGGTHILFLDAERPAWGIATSGLGGRSLTRGVASAVTVIARNASLADAAATAIANASFVRDENVVQRPAAEVDPTTDIPGIPVTVNVGPLDEEKKSRALAGAMKRTETLIEKGKILGAFVAVQGRVALTDSFRKRLAD